jgi:polyhydroxybutyrate depolymerase
MSIFSARRPGRSLRLFGLIAVGILAACMDTSGRVTSAQAADSGSQSIDLEYQGMTRSYRLYVPAGKSAAPRPLIVALHGGWGTGKSMEDLTNLDSTAGGAGYAVAYPDGVSRAWNAGTCCGKPMKEGVDDVGFLRAVVADVARRTPIDTKRVYGTGFSNGAMMIHRAACDAPDLFAAIAPASGGLMVQDCKSKRPLPALLIQGRADPRIPWDGGIFEGNFRPAARDVLANLAGRAQCSKEETVENKGVVQCVTRKGCAAGAEVTLCGLNGVGHQWAGAKELLPRLLGKGTTQYNASAEMVRFFSRH